MKNKSARHKDYNTFKFQPFAERIANIDVDIFHRVGHEYETQTDEAECYFYQAVDKWTILNLTESYGAFRKEIKAHTLLTLPQLVLDKDRVVEVLLKHLKLKNPLSVQPLLEIVVALAKDLRNDFYPHYKDFLDVLVDLLNTKDAEQLEWTFICLAYLFKFLWRPLVKDIATVFDTVLPLLSADRPDYVNSFAAGSFAFVARKVKDRETFLLHILRTVKRTKDGVEGCGKLFFEIIHGVTGQFHSCANTILPFFLKSLSENSDKYPQGTLFEILEQVVVNITEQIHPQKVDLLFTSLISALDNEGSAHLILKLLGQSIEHKEGKLVQDPSLVIQKIGDLLSKSQDLSEDNLLSVTQIGILCLLSRNIKLTQEQASLIVRRVQDLPQEKNLLYFIDNVATFSSFEPLILPNFLNRCATSQLNDDHLKVLTSLIMKKAPLIGCGINLDQWRRYQVNFGHFSEKIEGHLIDFISDPRVEIFMAGLIILPHLSQLSRRDKVVDLLGGKIDLLVDEIERENNLFFLLNTVECLVHLDCQVVLKSRHLAIINKLVTINNNILALKVIDLLITYLKGDREVITESLIMSLDQHLGVNFNSPHHEVRLLTTHIYSFFDNLFDLDDTKDNFNLFSTMYKVESIETHVHTYRDQLKYLEMLSFDQPQMSMALKTQHFKTLPLRFLCGCLYQNFKLIWEPVIRIIETHARGLAIEDFWPIFKCQLSGVVTRIRDDLSDFVVGSLETSWDFLGDFYVDCQKVLSRPDFWNCRILLWKALAAFPEVAEARNRDVSGLFLDFLQTEYTRHNSEVGYECNIKKNTNPDDTLTINVENGEREEILSSEPEPEEDSPRRVKSTKNSNLQAMINFLSVFAKFSSPKSVYREPELNKLYFDLLQHKNPELQKLALDCIMTYKHKHLMPYKDNLYNLIDERKFRNELSTFQIDKDSTTIIKEHRDQLIPVIIKIVFSKMTSKTGMRSGGKTQQRRNLVLRFLAGCEQPEMLTFIKMTMRFYKDQEVTLEHFVPPKRLQSSLNLLEIIIEQFGGLMSDDILKFVIGNLTTIGRIIQFALVEQIKSVHIGYLSILRSIKTTAVKLIGQIFEQFDRYPWSGDEVNLVFETFVWPYVDKLTMEGIHSPTALLRLLVQWGSNPRFFPLLVKLKGEETVLPHVVDLYCNEKSHGSVLKAIEDMFEKMLTLQGDSDIQVDPVEPIAQNILDRIKVDETLNYGSCILLPHVPKILRKIQAKLQSSQTDKDIFILSRVSELVWEPDISEQTLGILLPIVLKKIQANPDSGEEIVKNFLITIKNLVNNLQNCPLGITRQIIPLFGEVTEPSNRRLLVEIVKVLLPDSDLVEQLNAWDSKWVNQPDYGTRHDAFKLAIASECDNLELSILVIYNCFNFLRAEKDLSLRENSMHLLKVMAPRIIAKWPSHKELDYILGDTLFTLIRNGIRSKNIDYRNECIQLLGHLSRECPDSHFVLRDLSHLASSSDPEVDFFENITHLQLHRHTRGLLRVKQVIHSDCHSRTLTQFVLPLTTFYLCNDKYSHGKNTLIDASIEVIGAVAALLDWHQYETLLKYYLGKLQKSNEFQKQLVRVIVALLDAFHFDLSKCGDFSSDLGDALVIDNKVLCKSTATRVVGTIHKVLLPQLHKSLGELTLHDNSHKVNRRKTGSEREEDDLVKVPISLALVKLLQKLPKSILDSNLPAIVMKLCTFLKSPLESVRRVTRDTLQKIMQSLGPDYLGVVLGELKPLMTRGYQVHVLVFTTHSILQCLKDLYKVGDMDKVMLTVTELCEGDLFGTLSDEKEVVKITTKTSEAKSTKSYDTLAIVAQFVTESCLMDLLQPIKRVLSSNSYKKIHKAQEALRHIVQGLVDNPFIDTESLVKFAYGSTGDSMFSDEVTEKPKSRKVLLTETSDCFIIPKAPVGRSGHRASSVKNSDNVNRHVITEFGLRLLLVLLKRDKLKDRDYKPYLDPFVSVFVKCLDSKHVKLSTLTLQCLNWVLKFDLPSLSDRVKDIADKIFQILHKYASSALSNTHGDNFDLVQSSFKAMSVIVRDVKFHTIDTDQLKVLLLYCEQDVHDFSRQATAFGLLRAIIGRKLIVPEIHDVMSKVCELSIQSESEHIKTQARVVFHQYLMDYPLGDKVEKYLNFYLEQLGYELRAGRESAIEMVKNLIASFPQKVLKQHSDMLFISLAARLVNDDIPECRKKIADCLNSLIARLPRRDRQPLFDKILIPWLMDQKISHRRLAIQLCGIFVNVEKSEFEKRIKRLVPLILKQFSTESTQIVDEGNNNEEQEERLKDHHLYQLLQLLLKICSNCPSILKMPEIESLSLNVQSLLAYPHDWVRLSAAQFIGFLLADTDIDELSNLIQQSDNNNSTQTNYLYKDPVKRTKSLILDLCDQLQPSVKNDLAEQVIKNLVFMARVIEKLPLEINEINLLWLTKRMRKIVNAEVVETPLNIVLRTEVFKWTAGVATVLSPDTIKTPTILNHLLAPLVREMITTEEGNAPLRHLAKDVSGLIKGKIGMDLYMKALANLQLNLSVKRAERKRSRTQLAVTDPEVFAKKKIKRHEKKKEAKKRKIADRKGKKNFSKKRKVVDFELKAEEVI